MRDPAARRVKALKAVSGQPEHLRNVARPASALSFNSTGGCRYHSRTWTVFGKPLADDLVLVCASPMATKANRIATTTAGMRFNGWPRDCERKPQKSLSRRLRHPSARAPFREIPPARFPVYRPEHNRRTSHAAKRPLLPERCQFCLRPSSLRRAAPDVPFRRIPIPRGPQTVASGWRYVAAIAAPSVGSLAAVPKARPARPIRQSLGVAVQLASKRA